MLGVGGGGAVEVFGRGMQEGVGRRAPHHPARPLPFDPACPLPSGAAKARPSDRCLHCCCHGCFCDTRGDSGLGPGGTPGGFRAPATPVGLATLGP